MSDLELSEIQGLIVSGYAERPAARYALFEITDPRAAKVWLGQIVNELQFSEFRRSRRGEPPFLNEVCANIAFTYGGFRALGLNPIALAGFNPAFQEGLNDPNRARRLGDDGESAPEIWRWGGPQQTLHGVLAVYAGTDAADPHEWELIDTFLETHLCVKNGLRVLTILDSTALDQTDRKEHFGFRDGVSNPGIKGLSRRREGDVIAPGEVLLGYENGYDRFPLSPEVPAESDRAGRLPVSQENSARRDFGKNGSYLVFRQLAQDIQAFWRYIVDAAERIPDAPRGFQGAIWLASKFVGRWPNGTPLSLFPNAPGPHHHGDGNEFLFGTSRDAYGERCPIGSHIRRSNPRDTALPVPHDPELSGTPEDETVRKERLELANLHRIVRRGRMYGPPIHDDFDPRALLEAPRDDIERGLHFLCVNANISRQFEFIQSNWLNNPCFAGLSRDPDPILNTNRKCPFPAASFTIQGYPPRRVHNIPRFVEVRGGAYFFLPSKSALKYLSEL